MLPLLFSLPCLLQLIQSLGDIPRILPTGFFSCSIAFWSDKVHACFVSRRSFHVTLAVDIWIVDILTPFMSFLFSCYASRLLRLFLLDLFLLDPLTSGFIIPLLCFARVAVIDRCYSLSIYRCILLRTNSRIPVLIYHSSPRTMAPIAHTL